MAKYLDDTALAELINKIKIGYQPKLTAGANITISNNVISASGGGGTTSKVTVTSAGNVTQNIEANTYYNFTGELTALTLNLVAPANGQADNYNVYFYVRGSAPTLTVTGSENTLIWTTVMPDALQTYTFYELAITGRFASLTPVPNKFGLSKTLQLSTSNESGTNGGTVQIKRMSTGDTATTFLIGDENYSVIATPNTNFSVESITKNGNTLANNQVFTATEATSIIVTFKGDATSITWNTPTGADISVRQNSSSGATISNGGNVNYYDRVYIAVTAQTGYTVSTTYTGLTASTIETNVYIVTGLNPTFTVTVTAS